MTIVCPRCRKTGARQDHCGTYRGGTPWRQVRRARACLPRGESRAFCEECGEPIPEARRRALPGVRLCLECQQEADKEQHAVHLYNRKGSKDSQLR